jgi:hypothetical protein
MDFDSGMRQGLIRLPLGSERVVDADEEVLALFGSHFHWLTHTAGLHLVLEIYPGLI